MRIEVRNKLADILERVKEPENGLSIAQMNLVAGIKFNEQSEEFEVYMNPVDSAKACCFVFQLTAYDEIRQMLKNEIEKEFPNNTVVFKNV